jgi:hypothetical protein
MLIPEAPYMALHLINTKGFIAKGACILAVALGIED